MAPPEPDRREQVYLLALDVFDSEEDARRFMDTPHALLENQAPNSVSATEDGAKRVVEILELLRWGLPR